jgi:hypothetical protein
MQVLVKTSLLGPMKITLTLVVADLETLCSDVVELTSRVRLPCSIKRLNIFDHTGCETPATAESSILVSYIKVCSNLGGE